jgi:hypothetical protein
VRVPLHTYVREAKKGERTNEQPTNVRACVSE